MTPHEWIATGEVGISSKTIWAALMGVPFTRKTQFDTPSDTDDFQRCFKLLHDVPGFRERLPEVGAWFPKWKPFCEHWAELETLWISIFVEWHSHIRSQHLKDTCDKMYKILKECENEGYRELERAGWIKDLTINHNSKGWKWIHD